RQFGLEYDRPERKYGTTKYGFRKLYALATDGIASLSIKPLKLSQFFSILMALISLTIFLVILWRQLFSQGSGLDLGLMLLLFCVLITSTVQLLNIYILGAYVGRTYLEVKRRPNFIIRQKITRRENMIE
ncbi:MAG: glycosyltransferase, partial [bacterium]